MDQPRTGGCACGRVRYTVLVHDDDPSRFQPGHHFGESMYLAWLDTEGLFEKRTEDYPLLVEKWVEATEKFPA